MSKYKTFASVPTLRAPPIDNFGPFTFKQALRALHYYNNKFQGFSVLIFCQKLLVISRVLLLQASALPIKNSVINAFVEIFSFPPTFFYKYHQRKTFKKCNG